MIGFCVYGNPTIDLVKGVDGSEHISYGGGPYYSSIPLLERNANVEVYAVYSPLIVSHPVAKHIVKVQYSPRANIFKLVYAGFDKREISVLDTAPALYEWNVHQDVCYSIVNPVLGEVSANLLRNIRQRSMILAVDLQGFLRELREGKIFLECTTEALLAVSISEISHADLEELLALTARSNVLEAAEMASKLVRGVLVATIRPNTAIMVANRGYKVYELQESYVAADKTGAGDYFLAAYTYYYVKSNDEAESIFKAHESTVKWLRLRDLQRASSHPYRSVGISE